MPESIIPLTPSTSFRFYSAQGTANERALMYNILCGLAQLKDYKEVIGDFLSCNVKNCRSLRTFITKRSKDAEMIIFVRCIVSCRRVCRILLQIN